MFFNKFKTFAFFYKVGLYYKKNLFSKAKIHFFKNFLIFFFLNSLIPARWDIYYIYIYNTCILVKNIAKYLEKNTHTNIHVCTDMDRVWFL